MQPKKSLGQNFLMHRQIAERIVDAAKVNEADTVLEIGPGTGMLTRALLAKAGKVIAVEADHELVPKLEEDFADEIFSKKLEIIESDIRAFNSKTIKGEYKLVANIPYYITGEIIRQFLTAAHKPTSLAILVQKEVAVRIAREPKESLLSLSVKAYGTPKYEFTVPKGAFFPAPNVDSAVLSVSDIHMPFTNETVEARFFEILHAGFAHKRKRLAKNLEDVAPAVKVTDAFIKADIDTNARAEEIPLEKWQILAQELS
jgi:16S rRNA (adenine1518-N6/adenine1519-N6)-dimethyltransferase